jgi:hypothetical protein
MKLSSKLQLVLASAATAMLMTGCASTKTTNVLTMNDIEHKQKANIQAYSAQKASILGPVFFKQDGPCSEVDFLKFVNSQAPTAHDIIHVRMEYHKVKEGMSEKEYCKYFGLPVSYTEIPVDEATKWVDLYDNKKVDLTAPTAAQPAEESPAETSSFFGPSEPSSPSPAP